MQMVKLATVNQERRCVFMAQDQTLAQLKPGQSGVIVSVSNQNAPVRRRLVDMGLTPGTRVTVVKVAPFGDPVEVQLRGYELSLRAADAQEIVIGEPPAREKRGAARFYTPRRHDPEVLERMQLAHDHELDEHAVQYDATAHDKREMRVALAGNPNSGKTTLFNALTGSNQYVGNWPGVTVEKKEGRADIHGKPVTVTDLPGVP